MTDKAHIVVAGAGAVGSAIALTLARAGLTVILADPAPIGANASGVAAGMLAPVFETLFDDASKDRFELFAAARDLWPALADAAGLRLHRSGAVAVGAAADVEAWRARLTAMGAEAHPLTVSESARLTPALSLGLRGVRTPDDWRIDPAAALAGSRRAAERAGVRILANSVVGFRDGNVLFDAVPAIRADHLVIATGAGASLADLAPELAALAPVKGHILRAAGDFPAGPVIRAPGLYLSPTGSELLLGATMEPGRSDTAIDPAIVQALIDKAGIIAPGIGDLDWRAAAGVRAATTDGLPLVGEGSAPGVTLAVGARRNGWLLAPMIASAVLDQIEGRPKSAYAALFEPSRFRLTAPD